MQRRLNANEKSAYIFNLKHICNIHATVVHVLYKKFVLHDIPEQLTDFQPFNMLNFH